MRGLYLLLASLLITSPLTAQMPDSLAQPMAPIHVHQQDVIDVVHAFLPRWKKVVPHDSATLTDGGKFVWVIPQIGYTLQTGILAQVLTNVAFRRPQANVSTLIGSITYTRNKQAVLSLATQVWSKQNRLLWLSDWRLMHYPQGTFGLGIINTSLNREISMDYQYLRIYQSVLKRITPNLYAGLGYALDLHWNILSTNRNREVVEISRYREGVFGRSVSSGPVVRLLYDNRANAINPTQGFYGSILYRPNLRSLGSDHNYESLFIEFKTYVRPAAHSDNVLAFWSYNTLTLSGNPPFLDLPSTGWDTYSNTGRGFIQGRFRGKNLLYAETEYRFSLTRNRLLGGVVFANAQTVTEVVSGRFQRVVPAAGAGLRLNMNKISRTNLAIDYAVGADGSRGVFFNLGEVF